MPYAIEINLDYVHHPPELCAEFWNLIRVGMHQAGFRSEGRRFVIDLPESQACALAGRVIERIEGDLGYHPGHLRRFMKDFFGYDLATTIDLMQHVTPAVVAETQAI